MKKVVKARDFLFFIILSEGLVINLKKTCISGLCSQRKVTGLVILQEKVGIGREKYKEIRAKIHYIFCGKFFEIEHVRGWLLFILSVDLKSYRRLITYISKLEKKYGKNFLNKAKT